MENKNFDKKSLNYIDEQFLLGNIIEKYDYYEDERSTQLSDNRLLSMLSMILQSPRLTRGTVMFSFLIFMNLRRL